MLTLLFFFFQAEDGIRDIGVTGVQTCALPILRPVLALTPVTPVGVVWECVGVSTGRLIVDYGTVLQERRAMSVEGRITLSGGLKPLGIAHAEIGRAHV